VADAPQSTQEIAELMLDSGRNALLALDIKISIATLGVGCGAMVAGLFGMNVSCAARLVGVAGAGNAMAVAMAGAWLA
jgi:Mg2+ and Co2+ transporter CorA